MSNKLFKVSIPLMIVILITGCAPEEPNGKGLYAEYCQPCHGASGEGDGQLAYILYPKPRDLTSGLYKLRSTFDGQLPSDEDLFRTIERGMLGTSMPSFEFLGDENIRLIVEYIKSFDEGFEEEERKLIDIPSKLPVSERLLSIGKEAYTELGCHRCHGDTGRGDAPSAFELEDAWGYPIYVRDFTRGNYIGGYEPEDLYLRFVAGMSGTPMPSYESSLRFLADTEEELEEILWGLIHYVKDLETEEARTLRVEPPKDGIIHAAKLNNPLSSDVLIDPLAEHWREIDLHQIHLSRIWQTVEDDASVVNVKAAYTDDKIAILLEWRDDTKDLSVFRAEDFQDAAAVQFSLTDEPGFHGMGSVENPVDIWYWKASWQMLVDGVMEQDIEFVYTGRVSDTDIPKIPYLVGENYFLPGIRAGNIISNPEPESPVENVLSVGPETVTSKSIDQQFVAGKGVYTGENWRVVFVRELNAAGDNSVQLAKEELPWISFAVWDGSAGDRDGLKKVSTWYRLNLN